MEDLTLPKSCTVCSKPSSNRCSVCHWTAYCSPDCQKKDWSSHKVRCAVPQSLWPAAHLYLLGEVPFEQFAAAEQKRFNECLAQMKVDARASETSEFVNLAMVLRVILTGEKYWLSTSLSWKDGAIERSWPTVRLSPLNTTSPSGCNPSNSYSFVRRPLDSSLLPAVVGCVNLITPPILATQSASFLSVRLAGCLRPLVEKPGQETPRIFSGGCIVQVALGALKLAALHDIAKDTLGVKRADELMAAAEATGEVEDALETVAISGKLLRKLKVLTKEEVEKLTAAIE